MQPGSAHRIGPVNAISSRRRLARWLALGGLMCGCLIAAPAVAIAQKPPPPPPPPPGLTYSVTNLGSLGFGESDALGINAVGQVTGYSYTSSEFQVTCPPQKYGGPKQCFEHPYHAFLWSNGKMSDLGTFGGHFSQGNAINLSGEVVGRAQLSTGFSDGFLWNGSKMIDLGNFYPTGINDSGQIVGACGSTGGCALSNGSTCGGSCVLSNGKFTPLPNPPGLGCSPDAINNNGDVLGGCDNASSDQLSVVWENGTPIELGTLGGPQTGAGGINNLGQIVGWSQNSADNDHPFLWSKGTMTDLGVAPCNSASAACFFPAAINDNGVIVGGNEIYSNGTLQDLNTLIPTGYPQITYATAINDSGQIVADASGEALLLTPN
jgi:probable HAF family extracellular repeat protein